MTTDSPIGDALQAAHDARTALAHRRIEAEHELARVEAEMGGGE